MKRPHRTPHALETQAPIPSVLSVTQFPPGVVGNTASPASTDASLDDPPESDAVWEAPPPTAPLPGRVPTPPPSRGAPIAPPTRLRECEEGIEREWQSFVKVGQTLLRLREEHSHREWEAFVHVGRLLSIIRDEQLYRPDHPTFEQYCRTRWNYGKAHAYRLINAADTIQCLAPVENRLPEHESQVRPMYGLSREQKRLVWPKAVQLAGDRRVTAKHVQAAVETILPPKNEPASPPPTPRAPTGASRRHLPAFRLIENIEYFVRAGTAPANTLALLSELKSYLLSL